MLGTLIVGLVIQAVDGNQISDTFYDVYMNSSNCPSLSVTNVESVEVIDH